MKICPITMVHVLSNALEKVISNQLVTLLDKHSILSNSQFKIRKSRSTKYAIPTVTECVTENLNNKIIISV